MSMRFESLVLLLLLLFLLGGCLVFRLRRRLWWGRSKMLDFDQNGSNFREGFFFCIVCNRSRCESNVEKRDFSIWHPQRLRD